MTFDVYTDRRWDRGAPLDPAFVEDETKATAELLRGDFARWARPGGYELREELTGFPERLFTLRLGDRWYAGYKTISDYVLDHDMPGVFCSRVYWHNILGPVTGIRVSDSDARLTFTPLAEPARRAVFDAVTPLTELVHPFAKHRERGKEKTSAVDGWLVTDERSASNTSAGTRTTGSPPGSRAAPMTSSPTTRPARPAGSCPSSGASTGTGSARSARTCPSR
jgi:isonocardicin synthase